MGALDARTNSNGGAGGYLPLMRVLICPDSFTGTLSAPAAARAIAAGWHETAPDDELVLASEASRLLGVSAATVRACTPSTFVS